MKSLRVYACIFFAVGLVATGCDPQTLASAQTDDPRLCAQTSPDACSPAPQPEPPVLNTRN